MHGNSDRPQRAGRVEQRRLIAVLAIRLGWTMKQVRELDLIDLQILIEELSGKRKMTDYEISQELQRWQNVTSQSSSAPTHPSSRRHSAG